jgi:PPM family protein phosphatase
MNIKGFSHTAIGSREMNQDSFLVEDELLLYAVADGIGGGLKGDVASKMAVEGLKAHMMSHVPLLEAIKRLQQTIYNEALTTFGEALMGTTLTSVQIEKSPTGEATVHLGHAGDSRCYVYDGNILKQMSEDHESYDDSFQGSVLNSYLGIDIRSYTLKIQDERFPIFPGQRLLMCSDGLYKQIEEMRLIQIIRENFSNPSEMLQKMTDEASKAEHSDNITVVYVEVEA